MTPDRALAAVTLRDHASLAIRLPAMIDSTARAALRLACARAIRLGTAGKLTRAVQRMTLLFPILKATAIGLVIGTTGTGAGLLFGPGAQQSTNPQLIAPGGFPARKKTYSESSR